jgi:predicted CoA-substrate-specific enzyme activase
MKNTSKTDRSDSTRLFLGLDIGSISLNTVILDEDLNILENHYDYCHGQPFLVLKKRLEVLLKKYKAENIKSVALTGSGGTLGASLIGGEYINEIIAQSTSVARYYPDTRTIIEMGGEDSKLIFMEKGVLQEKLQLRDFEMNSICAAGTGSFLDQQAKRLGVSIEKEFGELAMKSENPPRIAGRCSVFAKSDMIHLQQIATPVYDIVAGLCFAVARNFISNLGHGKTLNPPIVFQGGVAANDGVAKAFRDLLKLKEGELVIPEYYASMGALGAVLHQLKLGERDADKTGGKGRASDAGSERRSFKGLQKLEEYLISEKTSDKHMPPLKESSALYNKEVVFKSNGKDKLDVYLGLDVGSLSTNVVLIDDEDNVVARRYLPTAGKPLDAIRTGMSEIYDEVGEKVTVRAAGTTGSGRYLTGDFIGADVIQNEITAQATAAIAYDPTVDTIFEIGGQDSKYISIDNGVVVDFEMNKVCAAGTGSFLEEQAEKLSLNIVEEFGKLALHSKKPACLGDRCTVFMESDLNSHQQRGETNENLVGGLAYSIVHNYIQKVVGNKRIGDKIFFQGGVTNNKGVVAAFEQVTGKKIIIPPHFDVTGAIGAAMLARDAVKNKTRFKGFGISNVPFTLSRFTCKACSNQCQIRKVQIEGEKKSLFYGGRCEKWEIDERKNKRQDIVNLFEKRVEMLMGDYNEDDNKGATTIGLPRALMNYYQMFPFWRTFFKELGFQLILSKETDHQLVAKSLEILTAETCFPVEVIYGHIKDLFEKDVDYIFLPFVVNVQSKEPNPTANCNCPWIQSHPFMIKSSVKNKKDKEKLLIPTLHFRYFERVLTKELSDYMREKFGIPKARSKEAIMHAGRVQQDFERDVERVGKEVLENIPDNVEPMVILGRPYNTGDPELNLSLIEKLINHNVLPIPVDFLPLSEMSIFDDYPRMYWPNGQKIITAARIIMDNKRLHAVYMSNFRCGPDSFLSHYITEEMRGKPYLQLEVDEHSADAGMITRIEAFIDSLKGEKAVEARRREVLSIKGGMHASPTKDRVLYFPYMNDAAYAVAAGARSCGIESWVLPMQDKYDLELGRKYTSSRECFPMICTTGSFLKKLEEPGVDPKKVCFFMPDHNGPCRFGQYNKFQRVIFNNLGYNDVEIVSPSNDGSYEDLSGEYGTRFRFNAWRGAVAVDLLRKMKQERRPYELIKGTTDKVYKVALDRVIDSIENGCRNLNKLMREASINFNAIELVNGKRKPIVAIVGEIFMRDNSFCNGNIIRKLEDLGAETVVSPFNEWLIYSTYRYTRDSLWKGDVRGLLKSKIQKYSQNITYHNIHRQVKEYIDTEREAHIDDILTNCNDYVHKDYDGDPPIALGTAATLARKNVSGIVNILPFTCMPGTLICALSGKFREDHDNIPWVDIAYDGQDDISIDTRLQAFMHQAHEFSDSKGYGVKLICAK